MTLLELLQEELKVYEGREEMSERNLKLRPNDINRSHYFTDMGITNGLLLAIDIVNGHERNK